MDRKAFNQRNPIRLVFSAGRSSCANACGLAASCGGWRRRRLVGVETDIRHDAVAHRAREIELHRPVAVHFEHEAGLIGPGSPGVAFTGRTLCIIGIDGMSAPTVSVTPLSGSLVRALVSLIVQSYCSFAPAGLAGDVSLGAKSERAPHPAGRQMAIARDRANWPGPRHVGSFRMAGDEPANSATRRGGCGGPGFSSSKPRGRTISSKATRPPKMIMR